MLLGREGATAAETLARLGIDAAPPASAAVAQGELWQPVPEADGYALAAQTDAYGLYVRPDNGGIAVLDRRSGYRWTSSPTREELAKEKVKGLLLSNLQSAFVLTYVRSKGADQTIRESVNSLSPGVRTTIVKDGDGIQASYSFPDKKLGVTIRYSLTEAGLKVSVPAAGIVEDGDYAAFSLDLLPYFGAAAASDDGYLFVPDGPGGLIRFNAPRAGISKGYLHEVYGAELTNSANWTRDAGMREDIAYPVFGLKKGDQAFVAVLAKGEGAAQIAAMPPGIKSSLYNVYSSQMYREEYLYRMSRLAAPTKAVQKQRLDFDREVEYRFLSGQKADYSGMAESYRDYLIAAGSLGKPLQPAEHVPLYLKIMGGNYEKAFGRVRYVAATTFAQAGEMMRSLRSKGVAASKVAFYGWQNMGDYDMEKRFPIESSLGGESAAKAFIGEMKAAGTDVSFYEDFLWVDGHSSASGKSGAVRAIDGTAFIDEGWFMAKPSFTAASAAAAVDRLKKLGVSGILYSGLGDTTFNDYEPSGILSRGYTSRVYAGLLSYTRKELGSAGVFRGNAYTLSQADYISSLPSESSYDFLIDETVPFYPMVLHGYVPYTFGEGNLRDDERKEFLRAIEYGAMPSFMVTHDDSRKLKESASNFLYSSRFDKWEGRIVEEYRQFDSLAGLFARRITAHEKLSADRYATTYEDGTRVIVDYAAGSFSVEKGGGA